ncbi:hypothetical protein SeMB42_g03084 [Synchytrium endobioticum]|uniref:Uncharacterized protein n=1 Tax=Synchytrium endobioticum TaxID=286115 RepID=A0A507DBE4_9FUNG|nr:hypothetical protein SeMB42_g03084 [Synchytrium endobioticum]
MFLSFSLSPLRSFSSSIGGSPEQKSDDNRLGEFRKRTPSILRNTMVHPVKVGVAAFLIFCTSALAAPPSQKIPGVRALLNRLRSKRGASEGMEFPDFFHRLANSDDTASVVLKTVADIAASLVDTELKATFEQLFRQPEDLSKVDITIARVYHSCVFVKLKCLFRDISTLVENNPSNRRLVDARERVWVFLVLFRNLDIVYYEAEEPHHLRKKTELPRRAGLSEHVLGEGDAEQLVEQLKRLMQRVINGENIFLYSQRESGNNVNDANRRCIDFFGNDNDCDQSEHTPVDYLAQSGEQELEFSIGWPHTERGKGATLHIEEPSPLALSSSNWHHPDFSSQSYDKGKGPMYPGGSTDLYPTQHAHGGSDGGSAHSESGSREASEGQIFHKWL